MLSTERKKPADGRPNISLEKHTWNGQLLINYFQGNPM